MPWPSPSPQQWRELYGAAAAFKELGCWRWTLDRDVFGVQNPATSEIGYCAVLGWLREVFGLVVYLGTEGLEVHRRMQSGEIGASDHELIFCQKWLMASFESRSDLQSADRKVIKALGLKFRGRNAWPLFRSFRPGYLPWFLTEAEAVYLSPALEQAADVCRRFRKNPEMLLPPEEGLYLVRVRGEDGRWEDEWLRPAPLDGEPEPRAAPVDEVRLERIRQSAAGRRGVWEADLFYAPMPVKEEDRPYYPSTVLWVERESGFILGCDLRGPAEGAPVVLDSFLELAEKVRALPVGIAVRDESVLRALKPTAARLDIRAGLVDEMPTLEKAKADLFERFGP